MNNSIKLISILLCGFFICSTQPAFAQDGQYFEDESSGMWESETFIDDTGTSMPGESSSMEDDLSDEDYVDESEVIDMNLQDKPSQEIDIAAALDKEKDLLPLNVAYGAASGLFIGGWLAFVWAKSSRDKARAVGSGVVLGALVGLAVGTKAVYMPPNTYSSIGINKTDQIEAIALQGLEAEKPQNNLAKITFEMNF